jgi:hypothetical protein
MIPFMGLHKKEDISSEGKPMRSPYLNFEKAGPLPLLFAVSLALSLVSACGPAPTQPPAKPKDPAPPGGPIDPGDPGDNPTIDGDPEPEPDPVDPDPDPEPEPPPPVVEPEPDCTATVIPGRDINGDGADDIVNCELSLGNADQFCNIFYPQPENEGEPAPPPDFGLLNACGSCDPRFYEPPPGLTECPGVGEGVVAPPPDGPDPNCVDDPTLAGCRLEESTCKRCHAPQEYNGLNSISDPHPFGGQAGMDCTQCHGGDGTANNPVFAHVCAPPAIGTRQQQVLDPRAFFLRYTTAGVQLHEPYECTTQQGGTRTVKPTEWLAFINPGDLRAGADGYGCAKCHSTDGVRGDGIYEAVVRMVMAQDTGINSGTRHGIGADNYYPDRRGNTLQNDWNTKADFGATDIDNTDYDPANRKVGEVPSLKQAIVSTGGNFRYANIAANVINTSLNVANINADDYPNGMVEGAGAEQLFQEVINQACTGCHLQNNYNNFRAGDFRTSGCAQCHFSTQITGRFAGNDPNVNSYEPVNVDALTPGEHAHRKDHRIRNVALPPDFTNGRYQAIEGVDDGRCIVCHEGSNRTVAQYKGYRLDQNQNLNVNNNNDAYFGFDLYPSAFDELQVSYQSNLFGENQTYNGRVLEQWVATEVWQNDVNNNPNNALEQNIFQDETPPDVHHEAGMGCVDCHGLGSTHGRGAIYGRMKLQTHEMDVLCETCHGTIDEYAQHNGQQLLDQSGLAIPNTVVNNINSQEFWLVSKVDGSLHYIPQTKDIVDATAAQTGGGKADPDGVALFNYVASYAMGRYDADGGGLQDGLGPLQPNNANIDMYDGFSHSDGRAYGQQGKKNQGLECYTCHAAWQNNCIGCHLDAAYDNNNGNYFYSQVTGERIYFNFNANFVYQNPINFMLGVNDRTKISPYQGMHRFFSYTDFNGDTSNRVSYSDRNGLGNDPALRNQNRNDQPALQNQPFTPHSIRGRWQNGQVGMKGCMDCHLPNANAVFVTNQNNNNFNLRDIDGNGLDLMAFYDNAIAFNVNMALGLGTDLWLFDADGEPVNVTDNAAVYNLDRIVEADGTTNSSSNHPLLEPSGLYTNQDYEGYDTTNGARVARPLTTEVLTRLGQLNNEGLGDVYYYTVNPANDIGYWLNDYNYVNQ